MLFCLMAVLQPASGMSGSLCSTVCTRGIGQEIASQFKHEEARQLNVIPSVGIGQKKAVQKGRSPISDFSFCIGCRANYL